jgi:hypothetical protein
MKKRSVPLIELSGNRIRLTEFGQLRTKTLSHHRVKSHRVIICGTCGEIPKDCHCAEDQEERKIKELLAWDAALPTENERKSEP